MTSVAKAATLFFTGGQLKALLPVLLGCLGVLTVFGCSGKQQKLNQEIIGKWVTDDPEYAGHSVEISRDLIIVTAEGVAPNIFSITGAKIIEQQDARTYLIKSETSEGVEIDFEFRLVKKDADLVMKIKNQPKCVWYKSPG